jgi:hypothetical protein
MAGAGVLAHESAGADAAPNDRAEKVLITSAETRLARAIAAALAGKYALRLTSPAAIALGEEAGGSSQSVPHEFIQSPLDDGPSTAVAVRGVDAIVHVAEPPPGAGDLEQIDFRTRGTYNLLLAAAQEGVRRAIYLSSLELMTAYAEDFLVTEDWRPKPGSEPGPMSRYLGEYVCREFAREGKLDVIVLRLGRVVDPVAVGGGPFDPLWVAFSDVVQAVALALERPRVSTMAALGQWHVFHIEHDSPRARFPVDKAKKLLGYQPRVNW